MNVRESRKGSFVIIALVYGIAAIVGIYLLRHLPYALWMNLLIADVAGTVVVFLFSLLFSNASVYDPYWSVFPVAAVTYLSMGQPLTTLNLFHLAAIWFWGFRLTANWAYTFHGLTFQDWRYTMLKERTGDWYPVINFLGIHLVPTLIVYLCVLPVVYALQYHIDGTILSYGAVLVSVGAVVLQGTADHQMHAFRKEHHGELIHTGLWTYSRHPNYLGEILMWWGIGLSVVLAVPGKVFLLLGAVVNNMLFLFVSIPMADGRQSAKPGFEEYKENTRKLLPIKRKK